MAISIGAATQPNDDWEWIEKITRVMRRQWSVIIGGRIGSRPHAESVFREAGTNAMFVSRRGLVKKAGFDSTAEWVDSVRKDVTGID